MLGPIEVNLRFLSVASKMLHKVSLQAMTATSVVRVHSGEFTLTTDVQCSGPHHAAN